jgi:hypothetical protein
MRQVYATQIVHAKIATADRIAVVATRATDFSGERRVLSLFKVQPFNFRLEP